jgi:hypothetical protein
MSTLFKKTYSSLVVFVTVAFLLPRATEAAGFQFNVANQIKVGTVEDLLVALLNIFIIIATPIIVLFIIYAGFLYVTAQGNSQQVEQATRALTYSIIGGVMVLGAVAISAIVADIVGAFKAP